MNKKGGTMVEASLVFPLIILTLMAMIAILIFLFKDAAGQAELHLVIRTEAGSETGTFHGQPGSSNVSVHSGMKGIHRVMDGNTTVMFQGLGIITRNFHKPIAGYQYLTDERKYVRYIDFFKSEEKEEGEQMENEEYRLQEDEN